MAEQPADQLEPIIPSPERTASSERNEPSSRELVAFQLPSDLGHVNKAEKPGLAAAQDTVEQQFGTPTLVGSDFGPQLRETAVKDGKAAGKDLSLLFNEEQLKKIKEGKAFEAEITVKTGKDSTTKLSVDYRPEHKDIVLSRPGMHSETLRIVLDKEKNPAKLVEIDDQKGFFKDMFSKAGAKALADTLPKEPVPPREGGAVGGPPGGIDGADRREAPREIKRPKLPDDPNALKARGEIADAEKVIAKDRQLVDYSKLLTKEKPVLFFGENHLRFADKDEMIKRASEFAKAGVTHFAMEMLPATKEMQATLDRFYKGDKEARQEIKDYLKNNWEKRIPGIPEKYLDILDAMKEAKIRPVGIDSHDHGPEVDKRNATWARVIGGIIKDNPNAKVVAFGGSGHMAYAGGTAANELLESHYGIKSNVAVFAGGYPGDPKQAFGLEDNVTIAAERQKVANERFQLRINPGDQVRPGDVVIHLPQKQKRPSDF